MYFSYDLDALSTQSFGTFNRCSPITTRNESVSVSEISERKSHIKLIIKNFTITKSFIESKCILSI